MNKKYYKVYNQRLVAFLVLNNVKIRSVHYEDGLMAFMFYCTKEKYESTLRRYDGIVAQEKK